MYKKKYKHVSVYYKTSNLYRLCVCKGSNFSWKLVQNA